MINKQKNRLKVVNFMNVKGLRTVRDLCLLAKGRNRPKKRCPLKAPENYL